MAFANTSGGHLCLGVSESAESPPVATSIIPVPRCLDLAERLSRSAQTIDPTIPFLQVRGIPIGADGSGVVLFRVPQSQRAPHRGPDKESYVRRDANSVPITMRDIQEMTLARDRREGRIEKRFAEFMRRFENWFQTPSKEWETWVGFWIAAVPVGGDVDLGRLFGQQVATQQEEYEMRFGGRPVKAHAACNPTLERPIMRGVRSDFASDMEACYREVRSDGSIDFGFRHYVEEHACYIGWILAHLTNLLRTADVLLYRGGAPDLEYAFAIRVDGMPRQRPLTIRLPNSIPVPKPLKELPVLFPHMSFGSLRELDKIINLVFTDLIAATGYPLTRLPEITVAVDSFDLIVSKSLL